MSAADVAFVELSWFKTLPERDQQLLRSIEDEDLFWEYWAWLRSQPDPEPDATADDYIHRQDPTYWSPDDIQEALGEHGDR